MSEPIKPALTAEEWAHLPTRQRQSAIMYLIDDQINAGRERMDAVADLALYNQPFGFTREMLKGIRDCAVFTDGPEADLAREAADTIEALLPPEKE